MICYQCRESIQRGASFCASCGALVVDVELPSTDSEVKGQTSIDLSPRLVEDSAQLEPEPEPVVRSPMRYEPREEAVAPMPTAQRKIDDPHRELLLVLHAVLDRVNGVGHSALTVRSEHFEADDVRARHVPTTEHDGMVWIPRGRFLMGSPEEESGPGTEEQPQAQVAVEGFWMDATLITNAQFREFVLANPEWQKVRLDNAQAHQGYLIDWEGANPPSGCEDHPVSSVSWFAARAYCAWVGKRLPTEAEWEYAARAGTTTPYWWGWDFDETRARANAVGTAPVRQVLHQNAWGLFDMLGNVWEWTSTEFRDYPYRDDDGRESEVGDSGPNAESETHDASEGAPQRVLRGGSWYCDPEDLRCAVRGSGEPGDYPDGIGFRCVQDQKK